ncbi:MAG: acylneuraminate cytidylyltransferase family protein [Candidatus Gastranaerophilales bacterium]|nr:acylneuraminate cytidylyltransferase family protein [Candidatus Gastranaerophilales bacterium]
MEILSIIPARAGSKGIPGKNIKMLAGKPLIAHTIEASLKSKYITRTVLSTESSKIKDIALSFGSEVVDRPVELAQDETKTAPVMLQVLDYLEKNENYVPDAVVLLQATCPLRDAKQIDEAFKLYFDNDCDSVFAVRRLGYTHAYWRLNIETGKPEGMYNYRERPRRQDTHRHYPSFVETGSIYIIKTEIMKKVKDFIGENPMFYLSPETVDIDTVEDFATAESLILQTST